MKNIQLYSARLGTAIMGAIVLGGLILTAPLSMANAADNDFDAGWTHYQEGMFTQALEIWEPLAKAGDAQAQFNLSVLYEQGRGVDADPAKARYWNDQAVTSGYPPALHNKALGLLAEKREQDALALLKTSAEQDFSASLYTLGKIHQLALGVDENPAMAFKYVSRAAADGFTRAQYNLGKMYRDGYGTEADETASAEWFEAAANQGYAKAQNRISDRYAAGQGVAQDDVQALKWAILASQGGIEGAIQKEAFLRDRMNADHIAAAEKQAAKFNPN